MIRPSFVKKLGNISSLAAMQIFSFCIQKVNKLLWELIRNGGHFILFKKRKVVKWLKSKLHFVIWRGKSRSGSGIKDCLISEGILTLVPLPRKSAKSLPWAESLNFSALYSKQLIQVFYSGQWDQNQIKPSLHVILSQKFEDVSCLEANLVFSVIKKQKMREIFLSPKQFT